jgi:ribosomal protein L16 Arg81 hydroxylase
LSRGGFGNSTNPSRLRIAATIPSATPFSMLRSVGPNSLKHAFLMARSLVLRRELREGFEPSHPQMAGGAKVEPLLVAHPLGIPGVVEK